jgi:hypothetical protein
MSYNGYTNEATYTVGLLIDNERTVYFPAKAIVREHGNAKRSAPYLRDLVTRTLRGENRFLTSSERATWSAEIRRDGGLARVNWEELAETEGQDRRRKRVVRRGRPLHHNHSHPAHPYSHPVSRKHRRR